MDAMRLVVVGAAGRMGRTLVRAIHADPSCMLAGAIEREVSSVSSRDCPISPKARPIAVASLASPCERMRSSAGTATSSAARASPTRP